MLNDASLLPLIELIYDAALNPEVWPEFGHALCRVVPSTDFNIHAVDLFTNKAHVAYTQQPPETMQLYFEKYHAINPLITRTQGQTWTGQILRSHYICPPEEFETTDYYQQFFQHLNLFHAINAMVLSEQEITGNLSLARSREMGIYTDAEAAAITLLMPHLQRAFRIGRLLDGLRAEREVLRETLSRAPHGVLALGATGRPILINDSARGILDQNDGLTLNGQGQIQASAPADQRRLSSLIEAVSRRAGELPPDGGLLTINRPSGARPLSLLIAPLGTQAAQQNFHQPTVLIFITDPERPRQDIEAALRHRYALTPAEARLASILAQGKNLVEAAHQLGITSNTARTHAKRIFQKTGTKRQSDLVQLVLNSPPIPK